MFVSAGKCVSAEADCWQGTLGNYALRSGVGVGVLVDAMVVWSICFPLSLMRMVQFQQDMV